MGNALVRVLQKGEDESLLTKCANARRDTWINVTNKLSQANLQRLRAVDSESARQRDEFFRKLRTDDSFPAIVRKGMGGMMADTFEEEARPEPWVSDGL